MSEQRVGGEKDLARALARVRRRWRGLNALRGLLATLASGILALVILIIVDAVLHPSAPVREGLALGATGLVAAALLAWALRPLVRSLTQEEAAILLERAFPSLDNRVINIIRLAREGEVPPAVLAVLEDGAASSLARVDVRGALPLRHLRKAGAFALVAVLLASSLALAAPTRFWHSVLRYAGQEIAEATPAGPHLLVEPGNALVDEGASLTVRVRVPGEIVSEAVVVASGLRHPMTFGGAGFAVDLPDIQAPFDYTVEAAGASSEVFHVGVRTRSRIEHVSVSYHPPEYLGFPDTSVDPSNGELAGVEGTRALVTFAASRPFRSLSVEASAGLAPIVTGTSGTTIAVVLSSNGWYRISWVDDAGASGQSLAYGIRADKDAPPQVRLLEPQGKTIAVRATTLLDAVVEAQDDLALASIALHVKRADKDLLADAAPASGRLVRASRSLDLKAIGARAGDMLALTASATDRKGQETTSSGVTLEVLDEAHAKDRMLSELGGIVARLRQAIAAQTRTRDATLATSQTNPASEAKVASESWPALADAQRAIRTFLIAVHDDWNSPDLRHVSARDRLQAVIDGPARKAVTEVASASADGPVTQATIVSELTAIVGELEALQAALAKGDIDTALAAPRETARAKAKDLLASLKKFEKEQTAVVDRSLELRRFHPEDFSAAQKKQLDKLRATEQNWAKLLAEKDADLSKVPPQDFSNGEVVKELEAATAAVTTAAAALGQSAVTLAVPGEQAGLELAKEITENIERWLASSPDNTKWVMEEAKGPADVPTADLPSELQDLMGDLIDKEDELADKSQDVTSARMDSMDKGVGWGASDGPISNNSAKGVTGNLQPNSNEIAGRSGEGRSGKSQGQMVGDEAQGKGGKETPTRLTNDAFEAGRVKDHSKEQGGATGGGKLARGGRQGLRGDPPPPVSQRMDRLADDQADVRNAAEKVRVALGRKGYVSQDLAQAIERMRKLEAQLRQHGPGDFGAEAHGIARGLEAAKDEAASELTSDRDPSAAAAGDGRDGLRSARDADIPTEYRRWLEEYYESLAEH